MIKGCFLKPAWLKCNSADPSAQPSSISFFNIGLLGHAETLCKPPMQKSGCTLNPSFSRASQVCIYHPFLIVQSTTCKSVLSFCWQLSACVLLSQKVHRQQFVGFVNTLQPLCKKALEVRTLILLQLSDIVDCICAALQTKTLRSMSGFSR